MLHKGVFSLGFQIQTLPQTQAKATFQLQTATGKLKAEIIPTTPRDGIDQKDDETDVQMS